MGYTDKEKQKQYQRRWIRERRAAWFGENGPCVKCGTWEKLELDHIDPATKITHGVWSWAKKRREEELAKCQALCEECHMDKTKLQVRKIGPEGTAWCSTCQQFLPIVKFYNKRSRWNGLSQACKICHDRTMRETPARKKRDGRT